MLGKFALDASLQAINNLDNLNCFYYFLIPLAVTIVYIFGHGNSNELVLGADNPLLAKDLLISLLARNKLMTVVSKIPTRWCIRPHCRIVHTQLQSAGVTCHYLLSCIGRTDARETQLRRLVVVWICRHPIYKVRKS